MNSGTRVVWSGLAACVLASFACAAEPDWLDAYNVSWNSPSEFCSGNMPLGNGDIGLNAWAQTGGGLVFYISKTDAWSGDNELLKVGRVRVTFTPDPFQRNAANQPRPFGQILKLRQGEIEIGAGGPGEHVALRLWVDANRPVIRLDASGDHPFEMNVALETWRDGQVVVPGDDRQLTWYQRNETSIWTNTLASQGLETLIVPANDPLLYRTFGGRITGTNLIRRSANELHSEQPAASHAVAVVVLTEMAPRLETWLDAIKRQASEIQATDWEAARTAHRAWWHDFWNRSWIRASCVDPQKRDLVRNESRGYTLQRFMSACAGRGAYPLKFNGSIFTFDGPNLFRPTEPAHADERAWGGCYWFQNTRLFYWPMLATGDYDLMQPFFEMYRRHLPLAIERTRILCRHPGAFFPETLTFWGTYGPGDGLRVDGADPFAKVGEFIRYYWSGGLELTAMMLDSYAHTDDRAFVTNTLLPVADAVVTFYDKHYARDAAGKLHMAPAQALETYHSVTNPLPPIAGLTFVLPRLLALPQDLATAEQRAGWTRLLGELPPLPKRTENDKTFLIPAETYGEMRNSENPELYAVFPYRLYGVGKPDLAIGRETFLRRRVQSGGGWRQDPIQAALLGLSELMPSYANLLGPQGTRFPAFWTGGGCNWIPDMDHGNSVSMGFQTSLLQTDDGKIYLFPAWPKDWDVEFKLHAPANTTVECVYRGGKVERLVVTPESRASDVVNLLNP
ncbi:MAG: DUF5703 domain-containing protein [Kiritimatiellae bacterium]|nr:DUF5703 domain-containing protein [Kiritimatiellia bacterium]